MRHARREKASLSIPLKSPPAHLGDIHPALFAGQLGILP